MILARLPMTSLLVVLSISWTTFAQDERDAGPIKYRHLYVPNDRIGELVDGLFPMQLDEFKERIKRLESKSDQGESAAKIERADYQAIFDPRSGALSGDANLKIIKTTEEAASLRLEGLRLAIGRPNWLIGDAPDIERHDAQIALSPGGFHLVQIENAGQLVFPWSAQGKLDSRDQWQFDLKLPASPQNQLRLTLDKDYAPQVDRGIVRLVEVSEDDPAPMDDMNQVAWLIELGGHDQVTLQIAKKTTLEQRKPIVLLREKHAYRFVNNKINVSVDLDLSVYEAGLENLTVTVDGGLEIQSARLGNQSILFRSLEEEVEEEADADVDSATERRVLLEFPTPVFGPNRPIFITAVAPMLRGQLATLPRIRPNNVDWEEARSTLQISKPHILQDIVAKECRVSELSQLPSPAQGESLNIQHFSPDANLAVQVDLPAARIESHCGTTLRVGAQGMTATVNADFTATQGELFYLEADFAPQWDVRSVDAFVIDPDGNNEEILLHWEKIGWNGKRPRLGVHLRKAVRLGRQVRITIRAFRPRSSLSMNRNELALYQPVADTLHHAVCIAGEPGFEMELSSPRELPALDITKWPIEHQDVVEHKLAQHVFQLDDTTTDLKGRVLEAVARYVAECQVRAMVDDRVVTESYRIRCLPESQIDRVLLHLTQSRDDSIEWSVEGDEDEVTARRLTKAERAQHRLDQTGGEIWELRLSRSRNVPFALIGNRSTPLSGRLRVGLVSLPEAAQQSGTLEIGVANDEHVTLQTKKVEQIVSPSISSEVYTTTRGVFRFDSESSVTLIAPQDESPLPSAWAWNSKITSRFGRDQSIHTVVFSIENTGRKSLTVRIPAEVEIRGIEIDGQSVEVTPKTVPTSDKRTGDQQTLKIDLPAKIRYPTLQVTFENAQLLPAYFGDLTVPKIGLDVPILESNWSVWLPPGVDPYYSGGARSDNWRSRLFGPLAGGHRQTLDPIWDDMVAPRISEPTRDITPASELAKQLIQIIRYLQMNQKESRPTWQNLFEAYNERIAPDAPEGDTRLLIDRRGLHELDIFASTPLFKVPIDATTKNDIELLKEENLALVLVGEQFVLTNRRAIATDSARLIPTSESNVAIATGEFLKTHAPNYVTSQVWIKQSQSPISPWLDKWKSDQDLNGWVCHELEISATRGDRLAVYSSDFVVSMGWAFSLLVSGLVWWTCRARMQTIFLVATLFGVVALLAPSPLIPITSGLFLGVLLGAFLVGVRPARPEPLPATEPITTIQTHSSTAAAIVGTIALLATVAFSTRVFGQDDETEKKAKPGFHPVVIPIDEDKNPTGVAYMPRKLYDLVLKHGLSVTGQTSAWKLNSANYSGELRRDAISGEIKPTAFLASFEVETFKPNAEFSLPFQKLELFLPSIQVNGTPQEFDWADDLVVKIESPGTHQIEFRFVPKIQSDPQILLTIPQVARSTIKLVVPDGFDAIEFTSALGRSRNGVEENTFVADLGPVNQLAIRWPVPGKKDEVVVDEAFWLKVGSGSVAMDAHIKVTMPEGKPVKELKLLADPRWQIQLLPDQPLESPEITNQGDRQLIRIPVDASFDKSQLDFKIRFILLRASGVGRLQLPRLTAIANRTSERLFAMSFGAALEHQVLAGELTTIELDAFETRWGGFDEQIAPQFVYEIPGSLGSLRLATKPRPRPARVVEQIVIGVANEQSRLSYTANLDAGPEGRSRYRLNVPSEFRVEKISITSGDEELPMRWSRTNDNTIAIIGVSYFRGPHILKIDGSLATRKSGRISIPRIRCEDVLINSSTTQIYRSPQVLLRFPGNTNVSLIDDEPLGSYREGFGRLFAAIQNPMDEEATDSFMNLTQNRPEFNCRQVTEVRRIDGEWFGEVTNHVQVRQNIVDGFRFSIPDFLVEPFVSDSTGTIQVIAPQGDRRQLLFRPNMPVTDEITFSFRGAIEKQPTQAPNVEMLNVQEIERYLLLPMETQWLTQGFKSVEVPAELVESQDSLRGKLTLDVSQDFPVIERYQIGARKAEVFLSEVFVACQENDRMHGVATFDILPPSREFCELMMPKHAELVHVFIDGNPTIVHRDANNRWSIRLASTRLPQRISVIFRGQYLTKQSTQNVQCHFEAPRLVGVSVRRTLWTIQNPQGAVHQSESQNADSALSLDVIRHSSFTDLVVKSEEAIHEHSEKERDTWYWPWANRLAQMQNAAEVRAGIHDISSDRLQEFANQIRSVRDQTGEQLDARIPGSSTPYTEPSMAWSHSRKNSPFSFTTTEVAQVEMAFEQSSNKQRRERVAAAVFFAAACLTLVALWRLGNLAILCRQYPFAVGVVLGMGWWLFLSPSIVGLLVVLVSSIGSIQPNSRIE